MTLRTYLILLLESCPYSLPQPIKSYNAQTYFFPHPNETTSFNQIEGHDPTGKKTNVLFVTTNVSISMNEIKS